MSERSSRLLLPVHSEASSLSSPAPLDALYKTIGERNPKFVHPDTLPEGDPKKKIIALIGHGHLDPVWNWDQSRGKARMDHTAQSALSLMEKNDDFIYTQSSPAFLQFIEDEDPILFKEIAERAQEGRWDAVGGGWVEPDMNLPVATSLLDSMRHCQQYYKNHLGIEPPNVALAADAFGFTRLQKLLTASGYDMLFHMRAQRGEIDLPNGIYSWRSGNGHTIFAERIFEEYGSGINTTGPHIRETAKQMRSPLDVISAWYGVSNHGGGPTQEILDLIKGGNKKLEDLRALQDDPSLPQLVFMGTKDYFRLVMASRTIFPEHTGEIQAHARGGYALGLEGNIESRRVENERERAKRFSVMANKLTGRRYPKEKFREAEQAALFNDFHDIRVRTVIERAEQGINDGHGFAAHLFKNENDPALIRLTKEIPLPREENTEFYAVVNPHAFPVTEFVTVEEYNMGEKIQVLDYENNVIPHQLVKPDAVIKTGSTPRKRIGAMIEIPAGGTNVFKVRYGLKEAETFENLTATKTLLENDQIRIRFDQQTGCPIEIVDKTLGWDAIYADGEGRRYPAFLPVICNDTIMEVRQEKKKDKKKKKHSSKGKNGNIHAVEVPVDTWAHKKHQWRPNIIDGKEVINFDEDGNPIREMETFSLKKIKVLEVGPVKATVRVKSTYRDPKRNDHDGDSVLVTDYTIHRGSSRVDIQMRLDWYEKHKALKHLIPIGLESRKTSAEGALETEVRNENGDEWATRNYVAISGRRRDHHEYVTFAVFNNGAPSYSMDNRTLGLTSLRSPDVDTHDPARNKEHDPHEHTDQGRHYLRYAFQIYDGDLDQGQVLRDAEAFNRPVYNELQTVRIKRESNNHLGNLPPKDSYFSCEIPNVHIDSIKIADEEGSDDVIVSFHETNGGNAEGVIHLFGKDIPVSLSPNDFRVIRVRDDGLYFETDVAELLDPN